MCLPRKGFEGAKNIDIKAVARDPLICSAVWFTGITLRNSELYDATIAFIRASEDTFAVPCIRVYAYDYLRDDDRQRGNAHAGCGRLEWIYFIPTDASGGEQWIYAHGFCGVGLLVSDLLRSSELNKRFAMGRWKISLQSLTELRVALKVSRSGDATAMNLVKYTLDSVSAGRAVVEITELSLSKSMEGSSSLNS
ncbi:hypothetical protein FGG08_005693 [Glutinoglossum americanum]|uniref:Uncharacterized protein n=1 Tax=Glutinoglossum americanum TaxID=1670608 RepID=A0A9P8I2S4_9PEZI|nr:hypothetical protein FGG08_005693 [Glutinoglossum americanum]